MIMVLEITQIFKRIKFLRQFFNLTQESSFFIALKLSWSSQFEKLSQSFAGNTLYGQPLMDTTTAHNAGPNVDLDTATLLQPIFNPHGSQITGHNDGIKYAKMELGNGRMCWFCDSDSERIQIIPFGEIPRNFKIFIFKPKLSFSKGK